MASLDEAAAPPAAKSSGVSISLIGHAAVLALLLAVPVFGEGFFVFQMTKVLIYALAIMGLNLLTGINGQFSLGHGAFIAVGAYTTAILMEHFGVHYAATLIPAAIISFIVGFLFGFPALRLEGVYLALATFALAVATPQLIKLSPFEDWTGGVQGIVIIMPDPPFGLSSDAWLYVFSLIVGGFFYWLARNLVASRTGRALMAIRDNPIAARSMGVNTALYKALAFGISAMITGVSGSLAAMNTAFVAPDSFTFFLSVLVLVGLVVGGVGWLPGALIGGAFILFVPNIAEEFSKGLAGAVYGLFLILAIYLAPQGAGGLIRAVLAWGKRLLAGRTT